MHDHLIALSGIAKFREGRPVLRSVDIVISPGELHLILGANGAGKSTLLRIMAGLLRPCAGEMERKDGAAIAYIGHPTFLYGGMTALQNLQFQARINGVSRAEKTENELMELLARADLAAHAHTKARHFSRGMAQRLNLCRALLVNPRLFLLDEPFTGLDAASRNKMRAELLRQRDLGRGIALVSHDPDADGALASHCHELVSGRLITRRADTC